MAKAKNDTFTPSGWNGKDPRITGGQFEDSQSYYRDLQNGDSNIGEGNRSSRAFASNDDMSGYSGDFLKSVNVVDSNSADYIGHANNASSRTSVDVSKADRGDEF